MEFLLLGSLFFLVGFLLGWLEVLLRTCTHFLLDPAAAAATTSLGT